MGGLQYARIKRGLFQAVDLERPMATSAKSVFRVLAPFLVAGSFALSAVAAFAVSPTLGTATVTIASPAVVTKTAHGLALGASVKFTTTGALPTGLTASTVYYVTNPTTDSFSLSTTYANAVAGTSISTSGTQSGTHYLVFFNDVMLNNEKLRFGGGGAGSSSFSYVDSVAVNSMLEQPFYKSSDNNWYKLTYSTYGLNMTLGSGTSGSNWSGATVPETGSFSLNGLTSINNLAVNTSGMTLRSPAQAVPYGYGTLVATGDVSLNGASVGISNTYILGQNASFVKITTAITNNAVSAIDNVMIWVGTKDDYVGTSDEPTKTRGNLVGGSFQAISNSSDSSNAIQITSGAEGVLFYSTTPNTKTTISSCCDFKDSYDQNPSTAAVTVTDDNSYAAVLPVGSLAAGATTSITWYYAAGALADLASVAAEVVADASPAPAPAPAPAPIATPEATTAATPATPTARVRLTVAPPERPIADDLRIFTAQEAPEEPALKVGGRAVTLEATVPSDGVLSLESSGFGFSVEAPGGSVTKTTDGKTTINVAPERTAVLGGTGMQPNSRVRAFLPLDGDNFVQVADIPVKFDGTFSGVGNFRNEPGKTPLPVGVTLLQLVSVDRNGNQIVVEVAVDIPQEDPRPEVDLSEGGIVELEPGKFQGTSAGKPIDLQVQNTGRGFGFAGDGYEISIASSDDDAVSTSANGELVLKLVRDEKTVVSGNGFKPATRADVYLFSEPTLVGSVTINEDGNFYGEFNLDSELIPVGNHTLQIQGVGTDGYVKAANMGVVVEDSPSPLAPWWTLWFILAGFLFVLVARWRRVLNTRGRHLTGALIVLASATPGVILGWLSTVTAVVWWAIGLGILGSVLSWFAPQKSKARRAED